jgi:hypothetical protein
MKTIILLIFLFCVVDVNAQDNNALNYIEKRKDPDVAALWSGFINCAGLIYADNDAAALYFLAEETYIYTKMVQGIKKGDNIDNLIIINLGSKVVAMVTAYISAKKYNAKLKTELNIAVINKSPAIGFSVRF